MLINRYFISFILILCIFSGQLKAQLADTIKNVGLDSVEVKAYGGNPIMLTASAINKITASQLNRYAHGNLLQAVNATAGVNMEERSMGSYRLNIRGSAARSPYGVRNVKIYYNGIPFTAPGGNSMLNMLGYYGVNGLEIIKGPAGSIYGAGMGGVVLLENANTVNLTEVGAGVNLGSYGAINYHMHLNAPSYSFNYEHSQTAGYRVHTEMKRRVVDGQFHQKTFNEGQLSLFLIYSDLFYQTPGALTRDEYLRNPRQSRPSAGNNPSAVMANASIHQKATYMAIKHSIQLASKWHNYTSVYGFLNDTENPAIQNYEQKKEPHVGGRTNFIYRNGNFSAHMGGELQHGNFTSKTYTNINGKPGTSLTNDELAIWQWMGFLQLNYQRNKWHFNVATSINGSKLNFLRKNEFPLLTADKQFSSDFQPRFAILYHASDNLSIYGNLAKGFSPPASSEIFADNNSYNLALKPESGWNIEPGIRYQLFNRKLWLDASYFHLKLRNGIVTRRTDAGANYFINAGKTTQQGVETSLNYAINNQTPITTNLQFAYTMHHFKYDEFVQLQQDFGGNSLPGVAPHHYTMLVETKHRNGLSGFLSYQYNSKVPLNDANNEYANAFHVVSLKVNYRRNFKNMRGHLFFGIDNLFDETYSLANDMNGFGGRYYNVAPGRSFYIGLNIALKKT